MKKYLIDDEVFSEEDFYKDLEDEVRIWVEDGYDDMLDDSYPPYEIGCCTFYASQVLKECDPIAYDCGINDCVDSELSNAKYELERQGWVEINGTMFEISEDDEEDEEDEEDE